MAAAFAASLTLQLGFGLSSDDPEGFAYIMLIHRWHDDRGVARGDVSDGARANGKTPPVLPESSPLDGGMGASGAEGSRNSAHSRHGLQPSRLAQRLRADLWLAIRDRQDHSKGVRHGICIPRELAWRRARLSIGTSRGAAGVRWWTSVTLAVMVRQGALLFFMLVSCGAVSAQDAEKLAPYYPTPLTVVEKMLDLGALKAGEKMFDLGSGDGRIVIMAAQKYHADATGVEIR